MAAHRPVNNSSENVPRFSGNGGFYCKNAFCRDTRPRVSGPHHNQKNRVRFSVSLRGAKRRGNLLERRTNLNTLPGDCTTGIPFGHHVGLCPPRNDNVILTWSFCFTQKKNPRFRETGGFGVLRHRSFCLRGISRADHLPFTPHQRTNCLSALPTRLSAGRGRSRRRRPASRPRPR